MVTRAVVPFVNEAMHIVMEGGERRVDPAPRLGFEFKDAE